MDYKAAELRQNYIEGPQTRRRNHLADSPRPLCRMLTASLTTLMLVTEMWQVLAAENVLSQAFRRYIQSVSPSLFFLTLPGPTLFRYPRDQHIMLTPHTARFTNLRTFPWSGAHAIYKRLVRTFHEEQKRLHHLERRYVLCTCWAARPHRNRTTYILARHLAAQTQTQTQKHTHMKTHLED